ncbi:ABC transporter permease [Thermococcus barophilus]|uniref:ABC transmembrane type-1 domain-containing protein n=1 Tax=Thermococcus barophilus (strain DSM 11836 / MP) TaxID=391623 RepID=F0LL58_THEBM|nr:ABC transporter permease [Thermococcus barophilus]ADT83709.1 hypothetical protein TERMP_00732 [Thermococcus barophilus MP]
MRRRQKIGTAILALFTIFVIASYFSVPKEELDNWENVVYWINYPKRAKPVWLGGISTVKLTPELNWSSQGYSSYVYTYEHKYDEKPNDIAVIISHPALHVIDVKRPDGILVNVYDGMLFQNITLNTNDRTALSIFRALRERFNLTDADLGTKTPTELLFSADSNFDTLKGTYTFRVLCNCSAPPEVIVYGTSYGLLGTDSYGRDIWAGFVKGMVNTLYLALFTTFMIIALGLMLGLISGYFRNLFSSIVTFFLEVLTALPILSILVVLTWVMSRQGIGARVEVNPIKFMLLVSILLVGKFAKTIRIMTIQEKSREHVTASISLGASGFHVIRRHILPVISEYSVRYFTFLMPRIVALISIFGFFGLIPGVNWGSFVVEALQQGALYGGYWWWVLSPGFAMAFLSLGFALVVSIDKPLTLS